MKLELLWNDLYHKGMNIHMQSAQSRFYFIADVSGVCKLYFTSQIDQHEETLDEKKHVLAIEVALSLF